MSITITNSIFHKLVLPEFNSFLSQSCRNLFAMPMAGSNSSWHRADGSTIRPQCPCQSPSEASSFNDQSISNSLCYLRSNSINCGSQIDRSLDAHKPRQLWPISWSQPSVYPDQDPSILLPQSESRSEGRRSIDRTARASPASRSQHQHLSQALRRRTCPPHPNKAVPMPNEAETELVFDERTNPDEFIKGLNEVSSGSYLTLSVLTNNHSFSFLELTYEIKQRALVSYTDGFQRLVTFVESTRSLFSKVLKLRFSPGQK